MRRRITAAAAISSVIAWIVLGGVVAQIRTGPGSLPAGAAPSRDAPREITLISGDRVLLGAGDDGSFTFVPRPGREGIAFSSYNEPVPDGSRDHLYVIPHDAIALIASGRLDRQLFDVTELVDSKYDDASRNDVPLIVTYDSRTRTLAAIGATVAGASVARQLPSANAVALSAPKAQAGQLWDTLMAAGSRVGSPTAAAPLTLAGPVRKIWLDRRIRPLLDRSVPQIGAPAAWSAGFQGDGVVVAVLDSGVDTTHPDLAGKVAAYRNFTSEDDRDLVGHGTHVASIIAGSGAASGGQYRGVAPGAQLVVGKVCVVEGCELSSIIAGIQWAVTEEGAKIVNLSLGGSDTPETDPLEQAVNELTAEYGALFVVAAGNNGRPSSVTSPASADAALAVGAIDRAEQIVPQSSRGPRIGDSAVKPEITAPGAQIVAALAAGSDVGPPVADRYVALSGTSMATPHVAGAAAILSQIHPEWGPEHLKAALMGSAKPNLVASVFDQGAGRVDVAAAMAARVIAQPASLNLGVARWPHDDNERMSRVVTYRNHGSVDVTLAFRIDAKGPDRRPAPAGMFTIQPATLTVPAGGAASATFTADPGFGSVSGAFGGSLIAEGEGTKVSTPFSIEREQESYDVRLTFIDQPDRPATARLTTLVPLDRLVFPFPAVTSPSKEIALRVPAGRYALESDWAGPQTLAVFAGPELVVDRPQNLTLDGGSAAPLDLVPPAPAAQRFWTQLNLLRQTSWGRSIRNIFVPGAPSLFTANLGERVESLTASLHAQWQDASAPAKPALYAATWVEHGALPTGPERTMPIDQSAVDHAVYARSSAHATEALVAAGSTADPTDGAVTVGLSVPLPHRRTEYYYSGDPNVRWRNVLQLAGEVPARFEGPLRTYQAGRRYSSRWNEPPYAPAFPSGDPPTDWAYRIGNNLVIQAPLFGDRAGHAGTIGSQAHFDVYRNGQKIGEFDGFSGLVAVPAESALYRVEAAATQSVLGYSSRVAVAWTFSSASPEPGVRSPLPLLSVHFFPRLDSNGRAFRGALAEIPISVRQSAQPGPVSSGAPAVEVSFDDGSMWQRAPVVRRGNQWMALVKHPRKGSYVSLRAAVSDPSGNAVEQTLIRAYGLSEAPRRAPE